MAQANSPYIIVTIDGPAGSGKSTVAFKLARSLAFIHLNSGALFRAVGLEARSRGIEIRDPGIGTPGPSGKSPTSGPDQASYEESIAAVARSLSFEFVLDQNRETRFLVDGKDKNDQVFSQQAGELASKIAVLGKLRQVLLEVQRSVAQKANVVVEGRDAGTIVFPDAPAKYFLEAGLEVRARRRFDQILAAKGGKVDEPDAVFARIKAELAKRDERDLNRPIAPGVAAQDAALIDTADLSEEQVVEAIRIDLRQRGLSN